MKCQSKKSKIWQRKVTTAVYFRSTVCLHFRENVLFTYAAFDYQKLVFVAEKNYLGKLMIIIHVYCKINNYL